MKKFKNLLKFYQNARKFERKLTDFVRLNCKNGREPHIRLPQTQEKHIKLVGATCGRPQYRSPPHVCLLTEQ